MRALEIVIKYFAKTYKNTLHYVSLPANKTGQKWYSLFGGKLKFTIKKVVIIHAKYKQVLYIFLQIYQMDGE